MMRLWVVYLTVCVMMLFAFFPHVCHSQLTQSLGWGSAGSSGKRSVKSPIYYGDDDDYDYDVRQVRKNRLTLSEALCSQDEKDAISKIKKLIQREVVRQRYCNRKK
uniref:Adipokinetic hormone 1 neuropeptide 2 n=1 Tax=Platynereis dumerilii TaxID=6359 RepID=V5TCD4_PLADU|nr:adipokinetic hormone 1 neuropeptide precursor 2 [Platynereis dumerilii]